MSSNKSLKFVWIILLALLAYIVIGNLHSDDDHEDHDGHSEHGEHENVFESGSLLPVKLSDIFAVELVHQGGLFLLEKDKSGHWFYHTHGAINGVIQSHEHVATPTENEAISISLLGLENARVERRLKTIERDIYGVTKPALISLVYGKDKSKPISQFAFGELATDNLSRYVHLVGTDQVATIADYQYKNLIELIEKIQTINLNASESVFQSGASQ